jgi:hypothetical protein
LRRSKKEVSPSSRIRTPRTAISVIRVVELGAVAHFLGRLHGEHDDLLDRRDDPHEQEWLSQELPLLHRRTDGEQQLDDDEDEQQDVEEIEDRLFGEVGGQTSRRLARQRQADEGGSDENVAMPA